MSNLGMDFLWILEGDYARNGNLFARKGLSKDKVCRYNILDIWSGVEVYDRNRKVSDEQKF